MRPKQGFVDLSKRVPTFQIGSKVYFAPPEEDQNAFFKQSKYRNSGWCIEGHHWIPHTDILNPNGRPKCPIGWHGAVRLKPKRPTNKWVWIDAYGNLVMENGTK